MSGFVAIVSCDGSPADSGVLRRLTNFLAFRGPDAQQIWSGGPVGLGHTLLRATREAERERQPMSLDGNVWIVADARLDAREELLDALARETGKGTAVSPDVPDVELILRAYLVWGEDCIEHLLGDFSFVIWNAAKRRLFAARDHFGVRPLFYAKASGALLLSNTLNCLRLHPGISSRLDERFIRDFLLIGIPYDPAITAFVDIARLPPGHTLACIPGEAVSLRRYWTLPIEEPLRYRHASEYVDQFRTLLRAAVFDRLRTDRVSISVSGGLDSPAVAAAACALLGPDSLPNAVRGVTIVFDRTIPDRERHFSGVVARYLGFPVRYIVGEDYPLFAGCDDGSLCYPEPADLALELSSYHRFRLAAEHGRVLLTGEGGDPALSPSLCFYRGLRFPSLLWGVARYVMSQGKTPRLGFRLMFNRWRGRTAAPRPYPAWVQPDFEKRAGLRERWRELNREPAELHPDRPAAYASLNSPFWSFNFNYYEPTVAVGELETRHPLFDVRLMRFFLRLPPLPWCADKELLRAALQGALPEEIVRRPKATLPGNPVDIMLKQPEARWIDYFKTGPELSEYIVRDLIPEVTVPGAGSDRGVDLRPLSLHYWLQHRGRLGYNEFALKESPLGREAIGPTEKNL